MTRKDNLGHISDKTDHSAVHTYALSAWNSCPVSLSSTSLLWAVRRASVATVFLMSLLLASIFAWISLP